jgi:hypothetical protein
MNQNYLSGRLSKLTICFVGGWASLLSLVLIGNFLPNWQSNTLLETVFVLLFAVMLVLSLGFYIYLGLLAKALGKSWIEWVGLSFIFKAIGGGIVAYLLMRSHVKKALAVTPQS